MFKKILIANRGEIACRIIRTAKKLQIETVAIYSEIDRHALHVKLADESYCIGPAPSQQSYLNREKILEVAKIAKAEAIHPGYGFLSEDATFAELCEQQNIIFIGPSATAILQMGNKSLAKNIMAEAGVPVVPGYHGPDFEMQTLQAQAEIIGYPVLIKASSGGGGKGMRLVHESTDLAEAIQSAKREAKSSFGDDTVFIEKYIENGRHIEVQIFADSFGNVVHLFDRDCSVQRRHQKIIEEAPAPNLTDALREKMTSAAINAAQSIHYINAGTIEFIVSNENFYFMEMNTRLQVEHPVTEMITGLDLVEWQLRVAAGEKLPRSQNQIKQNGHAFEARISAENPFDHFKPSTGTIKIFDLPSQSATIRIDTGIEQGDEISPHYDPMIAKIIVWNDSRSSALKIFQEVLAQSFIGGIYTNVELIYRISQQTDFEQGNFHTRFLNIHEELLTALPSSNTTIALASVLYHQQLKQQAALFAQEQDNPNSPWFSCDGWRVFGLKSIHLKIWDKHEAYSLDLFLHTPTQYTVKIFEETYQIKILNKNNDRISGYIDSNKYEIQFYFYEHEIFIFSEGKSFSFTTKQPLRDLLQSIHSQDQIVSPMPATVMEVLIQTGDTVAIGDPMLILEAMKMEHTLSASKAGIAKKIRFQKGDLVNEGDVLIEIE